MKARTFIRITAALFISLLIASSESLAFQDLNEVIELDGKLEKTFDVSPGGFIKVKNISGIVTITSWNNSQVKVVAVERRRNRNEGTAHIWMEKIGDRIYVETEYDENRDRRSRRDWEGRRNNSYPGVEYEIQVPDRFRVEASNVSGDVIIKDITGDVEGSTVSGDVELLNITGNVFANTTSGRIELKEINGEIESENVSGGISIYNSSIRNLRAKTISGIINIETRTFNPSGRYDLSALSGGVSFAIPSDAKASVRIKYRGKNFNSDFNLRMDDERQRDRRSRRYYDDYDSGWKQKTIVDDINGGGGRISIETMSGRIELRKFR